jgi:hypothetical protein
MTAFDKALLTPFNVLGCVTLPRLLFLAARMFLGLVESTRMSPRAVFILRRRRICKEALPPATMPYMLGFSNEEVCCVFWSHPSLFWSHPSLPADMRLVFSVCLQKV